MAELSAASPIADRDAIRPGSGQLESRVADAGRAGPAKPSEALISGRSQIWHASRSRSGVMDRPRTPEPYWPSLTTPAVIGLGGITSVTALSAWLVFTDPLVAADVAAAGSLMPLVVAIVDTLRDALAELLAFL
jgi:hypothetical protein